MLGWKWNAGLIILTMINKTLFIAVLLFVTTTMLVAQSTKEVILTNHPSDDRYASYSPSGNHILFESNRDGNWEIYIMSIDGSHQINLTNISGYDAYPAWRQ